MRLACVPENPGQKVPFLGGGGEGWPSQYFHTMYFLFSVSIPFAHLSAFILPCRRNLRHQLRWIRLLQLSSMLTIKHQESYLQGKTGIVLRLVELKGHLPKNKNFISDSIRGAESNVKVRGACDKPFWMYERLNRAVLKPGQ